MRRRLNKKPKSRAAAEFSVALPFISPTLGFSYSFCLPFSRWFSGKICCSTLFSSKICESQGDSSYSHAFRFECHFREFSSKFTKYFYIITLTSCSSSSSFNLLNHPIQILLCCLSLINLQQPFRFQEFQP